jgi:plastocyanin
MRFNTNLPFLFGFVSAAAAATHEVKVGNDLKTLEALRYSPNVTTAAVGDTVVFHFWPGHHNVVQGDYSNPCNPSKDAFYSGFISPSGASGEADKVFTITINNTDPIWFYCSETEHCQNGMVAVINPP